VPGDGFECAQVPGRNWAGPQVRLGVLHGCQFLSGEKAPLMRIENQ
jgi:hypothetical protein